MKTKRAGARTVFRKLDQSVDHSTLFHWMVEHHDEMLARANGSRLRWSDLILTFRELGLTTRDGEPPNEANSRQTWYRARKTVAQRQASAARKAMVGLSGRSLMPSAAPAGRQPTPLSQSTTHVTSAAEPQPNTPNSIGDTMRGVEGPVSKEVAKARLAELRRTLEERSGR